MTTRALFAVTLVAALSSSCSEAAPPVEPAFPDDYRTSYTMVRDCRRSIEHDLVFVRVWADPTAAETYLSRDGSLPDGSVIVKEEFDDEGCTDLIGFTVMQRQQGFAPASGDWRWQEVTADRTVVTDGVRAECFLCHEACEPPEGFDWTCAVP